MADQSSGPLGLPPTVWVVLIVGLAGAFAATQHPFEDARPSNATVPYRHTPSEDQDIEARQWEDPFSAVALAKRVAGSSKAEPSLSAGDDPHDIERLSEARLKTPNTRMLVLGAMVPGAPYADDIETRRRTRYAVLAGLFQEGYVPDDSEHIGYLRLPKLPEDAGHTHDIAAFEWLHEEPTSDAAPHPRVLLLWLDQTNFQEAPFRRLALIVNRIAGGASNGVSASFIGPADSAGLKAMSTELDEEGKGNCAYLSTPLRDMSVFSPRATALDWLIVSSDVRKRYLDTGTDAHVDYFNDRCSHVHLYRTVASDFTVVRAVYKELQYRGIRDVADIALVTERDTLYSRLMSRYFNGCAGTPLITDRFTVTHYTEEGEDTAASDDRQKDHQPQCFTYLRGLDGLAPPSSAAGDPGDSADSKSADSHNSDKAATTTESATGQGQLDYLRRLTTALASTRDDPACGRVAQIFSFGDRSDDGDRHCGHHIKAIGVVGSDIYDKLLVLQALRRAFPRYIFFTTDLDARLTDTSNLPWTRELVVGSSLGLSLRPELQGSVQPFRDTYQTATYYSTMQAIRQYLGADAKTKPDIDTAWTHRPHVFEVGRTQAFDLSANNEGNTACSTIGECRSIAAWRPLPLWATGSLLSYLICMAIVVSIVVFMSCAAMGLPWATDLILQTPAAAAANTTPRRRLIVAAVSLLLIACGAIVAWSLLVGALSYDGKRIPAPIFSGASHWAAASVEALSIVLVITLVVRGQRKLTTNAVTMLHEFHFAFDGATMAGRYEAWLMQPHNHSRWAERFWLPIRRLSGNQEHPLRAPPESTGGVAPAALSELEMLIGQYLYRGRYSARFKRVISATIISSCVVLALEYFLMVLEFNLGASLVNGFALFDFRYVERGIENCISLLNLFALQFLIFWVADALLLTRSFVLALAKDRPHWPQDILDEHADKLGLPSSWTAMWLDLRLIAWRTGRVAILIWYPSILLAGMAIAAMTVEFGELGFASNPIALIIGAAFVVGAAVLLRRVAESWRSDVIFRIDDARLNALGAGGGKPAPISQLDRLAERVASLSEGAFAPYSQQPLVRAVLVPAITYGATAGLQFLHLGT